MSAYLRDTPDRVTEFIRTYVADTDRGVVASVNDIYGFNHVAIDISVEDEGTFIYKASAVVIGKKVGTGLSISKGEYVYGDPTDNFDVSATKSAGYVYLGVALEDATADDTTIDIDFDGTMTDVR